MIKLFYKLLCSSFKSKMQYRASFLIMTFSHFIGTFVEFIGIWVLFDRFKVVKGWTLPELMLTYGIVNAGFAIAESLARGFDLFGQIIKSGDFDRILLRPIGTLFQIATKEIAINKMGRLLQGATVLIVGAVKLNLSLFAIITIIFSVIGTSALFYGILIFQATITFWTTETLELMNVVTYGGVEAGQFPMSLYNNYFRLFFTLLIPLACVVYYPVAILLKHELFPLWLSIAFPLIGFLFLYMACHLWKIGVKHYHSTGS